MDSRGKFSVDKISCQMRTHHLTGSMAHSRPLRPDCCDYKDQRGTRNATQKQCSTACSLRRRYALPSNATACVITTPSAAGLRCSGSMASRLAAVLRCAAAPASPAAAAAGSTVPKPAVPTLGTALRPVCTLTGASDHGAGVASDKPSSAMTVTAPARGCCTRWGAVGCMLLRAASCHGHTRPQPPYTGVRSGMG
jgi:hypothetical protein